MFYVMIRIPLQEIQINYSLPPLTLFQTNSHAHRSSSHAADAQQTNHP
jgi:hypothetical protein